MEKRVYSLALTDDQVFVFRSFLQSLLKIGGNDSAEYKFLFDALSFAQGTLFSVNGLTEDARMAKLMFHLELSDAEVFNLRVFLRDSFMLFKANLIAYERMFDAFGDPLGNHELCVEFIANDYARLAACDFVYLSLFDSFDFFRSLSYCPAQPESQAPVVEEEPCVVETEPDPVVEDVENCSDCFSAVPAAENDSICENPESFFFYERVGDGPRCEEFAPEVVSNPPAVACSTCNYACPDEPDVLCLNSIGPFCGHFVNRSQSCTAWVQREGTLAPPGTVP